MLGGPVPHILAGIKREAFVVGRWEEVVFEKRMFHGRAVAARTNNESRKSMVIYLSGPNEQCIYCY